MSQGEGNWTGQVQTWNNFNNQRLVGNKTLEEAYVSKDDPTIVAWDQVYNDCGTPDSVMDGNQIFHFGYCPWGWPGINSNPNCEGTFTAKYMCGHKSKNLSETIKEWGHPVNFDCTDEVELANSTKLTLSDEGELKLINTKNSNTPLWTWRPKGYPLKTMPNPAWLVGCEGTGSHPCKAWNNQGWVYIGEMKAGDTLANGNYWLASPNGGCRLVPHFEWDDGTQNALSQEQEMGLAKFNFNLRLEWRASNCDSPKDVTVPSWGAHESGRAGGNQNSDAIALYQVPQMPDMAWTSASTASYISGLDPSSKCVQNDKIALSRQASDAQYMYGEGSWELGDDYFKVADDYDTGRNDLSGAAVTNTTVEVCKNTCSQLSGCAGFVFDENTSKCWPKTDGMFPKGLRTPADGFSIYLRKMRPKTDVSCPKDVIPATVHDLQYFPRSGENVDPNMKCDLALATSCDETAIDDAVAELKGKRQNITDKIKTLGNTNARLVAELGYNVDRLENDIYDYDETVTKNNDLKGDGLVGPKARQEDTDLQMISENYKYLLWTIAAVAVVGVGAKITSK